MAHSLLLIKILCAVLLPLETALGTLIPVVLKKTGGCGDRLMTYSVAAAAGVFLAVGLCHMADDAYETLSSCLDTGGFPLAMFLVIAGFSVMLFLDKTCTPHSHTHSLSVADKAGCVQHSFLAHQQQEPTDAVHLEMLREVPVEIVTEAQIPLTTKGIEEKEGLQILGVDTASWKYHYFKAAVLTSSMAVHAIVTGLAVGIAEDMDDLIGIAIACFSHEWTHSAALVVLYISLGLTKKAMAFMLVPFILCTPVSICVGIGLVSSLHGATSGITQGVLLAIAAGAFIFVAACELVGEIFDKDTSFLDKLVSFCLFCIFSSAISSITVIEGDGTPACST